MYVCLCNPFSDKDLDNVLKDDKILKKTSSIYSACSGGEKPCCGTCICEINDRIKEHNAQSLLMAAE